MCQKKREIQKKKFEEGKKIINWRNVVVVVINK
jgi:hypothetical protein